MEVSTLSRLIGTHADAPSGTRRRSGKDARAVRIRISDHGRALAKKLVAAASNYEAAMTRNLRPRQVQELKRVLAQIDDTVATLATEPRTGGKTRPARGSSAA